MTKALGIVGDSVSVRKLREAIEALAGSRLPVLIQGPTGAGKELVAAALHARSGRRGTFVRINMAAIGESIFEAAFFGHVRGAYTGALSDGLGFLREGHEGTVFLDEISGLPVAQQPKLLRALESGEFRPVGARRDEQSDFRIVSATNERMETLVEGGRFRGDLMHRISTLQLDVPALGARREDIPALVEHFLEQDGIAGTKVSEAVLRLLGEYHWPGNVRELKNVVQGCTALGGLTVERVAGALASRRALCSHPRQDAAERQRLVEALRRHQGNTVVVANELGVDRSTVYRWMRQLGIEALRA